MNILPRWLRNLIREPIVKIALAALVVAALVASALWIFWPDPSCGEGVEERGPDRECTGVTDGTVSFHPGLDEVFSRIRVENDRIAGRKDADIATVALMIPMTSDSAIGRRQIREEVQGAYLAQYRANHLSNSRSPAIRLVLANPGRGYAHWRPVADQLAGMADSPRDNLRAVTGFNVSLGSTREAIAHLTGKKGIPVVGGPITADDFGNSAERPEEFPGLARVAPTNSDQAAALASFDKTVESAETLVVTDLREGDNYIGTLRQTFERLAEDAPLAPETYRSPADVDSEGSLSNDFQQMVSAICDSSAKVIYFAGRPVQLRQFVNELGERSCTDRQYTVVSGSHASLLAEDRKVDWDALRHGVTVQYAALAHPDAWTGPGAPPTGGSAADYRELSELAAESGAKPVGPIGTVSLTDSRTIITHDSVWAAVRGIRDKTGGGVRIPQLAEVANAWLRLHGESGKVRGASGWICLDNYGNAYNKAVSVVHLDPRTRQATFDGLAWPEGEPPAENCSVPNRGPGR